MEFIEIFGVYERKHGFVGPVTVDHDIFGDEIFVLSKKGLIYEPMRDFTIFGVSFKKYNALP